MARTAMGASNPTTAERPCDAKYLLNMLPVIQVYQIGD